MLCRSLFCWTVVLGSLGSAWSQDAVKIVLHTPSKGEIVKSTRVEEADNKVVISINGNEQTQNEKGMASITYTEEVIEAPKEGRRPIKLKRTYEKASRGKTDLGLEGKTIIAEKKDGKYEFTFADGSAVTGVAGEYLNKEMNTKSETADETFLPKEAVKPGATWNIDMKAAAKDFAATGMTLDAEKSKGTGKLIKVYEKDGLKFGEMEIELKLTVTKMAAGRGAEMTMKDGSNLSATLKLDVCIDGKSPVGNIATTSKGELLTEQMGASLTITLNSTGKVITELSKAK